MRTTLCRFQKLLALPLFSSLLLGLADLKAALTMSAKCERAQYPRKEREGQESLRDTLMIK